ncbi:hypothetical protein AB4Z25_18945 [Rhizobium sp. RAF36]|uniref:hypothetical protein n=1 Tax=Rhizobium sp. RAF36 TaxID=3233055 RepID=UPI000DD5D083
MNRQRICNRPPSELDLRASLEDIERSIIEEQLVPANDGLLDRLMEILVPPAYSAETKAIQATDAFSPNDYIRPGILLVMLLSITVFFVTCIITYFRTSDPERLKFCMNSIQTTLGFYIGVFTGLLGLQPAPAIRR